MLEASEMLLDRHDYFNLLIVLFFTVFCLGFIEFSSTDFPFPFPFPYWIVFPWCPWVYSLQFPSLGYSLVNNNNYNSNNNIKTVV